jgi:nitrate reductase NapE component
MTPSWRKPVGMLLILLILVLWCVLSVTLVEALALPAWAQGIAFLAMGLAWLWIFPMRRMLRWMELGLWRD